MISLNQVDFMLKDHLNNSNCPKFRFGRLQIKRLHDLTTSRLLSPLARRIIGHIIFFATMLNLIFILPRISGGGALRNLAGISNLPNSLPQVASQQVIAKLGLGHPLYYQYALFMKDIFLTFPPYFGFSYEYFPLQVSSLVIVRGIWSLVLLLPSLVLGMLIAYGLARFVSRNRKLERGLAFWLIVFNALPLFWVSMIMIFGFGVHFTLFPESGAFSPFLSPSQPLFYVSVLSHMALPVVILSWATAAFCFLILRQPVQYNFNADYIRTARSRGLSNSYISLHYRFGEFLSAALSYETLWTASIIVGLILIESVFGWPGLGNLFVDSMAGHDYPVMFGLLFYFSLIEIAVGLAADILHSRIDPRFRMREVSATTHPTKAKRRLTVP